MILKFKRSIKKVLAIIVAACGAYGFGVSNTAAADGFVVTSPAFAEGELLSQKFSGVGGPRNCKGNNVSPPLQWKNSPKGTLSFAIVLTDMDGKGGPHGAGIIHWIAYGIPASTLSLAEGEGNRSSSKLIGGKNAFGTMTYSGPCPQEGGDKPHQYTFSIFALRLDPGALKPGLDFVSFENSMGPHLLNAASISVRQVR